MRILMVSEDVPYAAMGGLAKHALNLARALIHHGHTVDFLGGNQNPIEVAGPEGNFGGQFFGKLSGHLAGWKERSLGVYIPYKRTWLAKRFARIIARYSSNYDVVHYHGHVPNLALYLPDGINFIQTRHDQGSDCLQHTRFKNGEVCTSTDARDCAACITSQPNYLQRKISTIAVERFRKEVAESFRLQKTIFVSDMLRRNFSRSMGNQPWGDVIHNFVDQKALEFAASSPERMPDAANMEVIVVGKLYPPKGIDKFISEFTQYNSKDISLLIVGDGPQLDSMRSAYASQRVRFVGWCDSTRTLRLIAAADAVVVPSIWEEPCATTVFEGLLLGKPTFALARGGTTELSGYALLKNQLHLHASMVDLVDDLLQQTPTARNTHPGFDGAGSVDNTLLELVPIYQRLAGIPEDDSCH